MTLLGLTLVVGVLVDDAIVEIENIVRHLRRRPAAGAYRAALEGSAEIGLAVVATTRGDPRRVRAGGLHAGHAGPVLSPVRPDGRGGRGFLAVGGPDADAIARRLSCCATRPRAPGRSVATGVIGRRYLALLRCCLHHRVATVAAGVAFFGASVALAPLVPRDFVAARRSRPIRAVARTRARCHARRHDGGRPGGDRHPEGAAGGLVRPGRRSARPGAGGADGAAIGSVVARPGDPRTATLTVDPDAARGSRPVASRPSRPRCGRDWSACPVRGCAFRDRPAERIATADHPGRRRPRRARRRRAAIWSGRCAACRSWPARVRRRASAHPELRIVPHEARAAELGVSVAGIGATARIATIGDVDQNLARFDLPDRQIPIRVMLDERARGDIDVLRTLAGRRARTAWCRLSAVAEIRHGPGRRRSTVWIAMRKITVEAELNGVPLGEAVRQVAGLPVMRDLPAGVHERRPATRRSCARLFGGFALALGAGVLLVYLVLVLLFGGLLQPLTIMSALPLSLGGALLALLLTRQVARRRRGRRRADADGHRGEELDPAGRIRPLSDARARPAPRRGDHRGGAQARPADRDDHGRDVRRHAAHRASASAPMRNSARRWHWW